MQRLNHAKLVTWYAQHPPLLLSKASFQSSYNDKHPLKLLLNKFYCLTVFTFITLFMVLLILWAAMRLIYPQLDVHKDDLTDYEILLKDTPAYKGIYDYDFLKDSFAADDLKPPLEPVKSTIYINCSRSPQVIIICTVNQQKDILRFILVSNKLQLLDLLLRWGRPNYKQKDNKEHHWDLKWERNGYIVAIESDTLKLNTPVNIVSVSFNP